jgi:DNA end-binding protein Ku
MRSSWSGSLACGLLVVPVKLYRATDDNEYSFRTIHKEDGGPLNFRRICSVCGEEVAYADAGRGKEVGGQMLVLTDDDLDSLPLPGAKVINMDLFIGIDQLDLTGFGNAYYVEPDDSAVKVYTLLRQAMKTSGKVAVARFAMRVKDSLAIVRPHGKMLILQLIAWPSAVREPAFKFVREEVTVTDQERGLAAQLIDTMSGPWEPSEYHSKYDAAVKALLQSKQDGAPPPPEPTPQQAAAVTDIGEVLRASIEQVKKGEAA